MHATEAHLNADAYLEQALSDPDCAASIGVSGAIAEFMRSDGRAEMRREETGFTLITRNGAMRVALLPRTVPVAAELPAKLSGDWQQHVAFCLDEARAAMSARRVITELGPDEDAIDTSGRSWLRFDLGLGIPHVDACVRTSDSHLIALLRRSEGRALLAEAREVRDAIVALSPARVFCSQLGRIEVSSPIPERKTPVGPHTHLLPELLGRPSPIAEFIPRGLVSCLDVYPAHPLRAICGAARPFDRRRHACFQRAIRAWAPPAYVDEKLRLSAWVRQGRKPEDCLPARGNLAALGRRMALRQLRPDEVEQSTLAAWQNSLDPM